MKNIICFLLIAVSTLCQGRGGNSLCTYRVKGNLDWNKIDAITIVKDSLGSENIMTIKSAWTKDSLYFHYDVIDFDLRCHQLENDHSRLFLDDMVEFLIDPRNDHGELWLEDDVIYHINILGYKKDDRGTPDGKSDASWNGVSRYSIVINGTVNDSSDLDEGYEVEVAVPWSELGVTPRCGLVMGVDFVCGDNDGKGRQLFDMAGAKPFRNPIEFCLLKLMTRKKKR